VLVFGPATGWVGAEEGGAAEVVETVTGAIEVVVGGGGT